MRERVRERASPPARRRGRRTTPPPTRSTGTSRRSTRSRTRSPTPSARPTTLVADARTRVARIDAAATPSPACARAPEADDDPRRLHPAPGPQGLAGRHPARTVTGACADHRPEHPAARTAARTCSTRCPAGPPSTLPELRLVAEPRRRRAAAVRPGRAGDATGRPRGPARAEPRHRRGRGLPRGARLPARPGDSLAAPRPARRRRRRRGPARRRRPARHPRRLALDLDVAAGDVQAKAWHRQAGEAVATLSTVDGIVFELAWFPTPAVAGRAGPRRACVPEDLPLAGLGRARRGRPALTSWPTPPPRPLRSGRADLRPRAGRPARRRGRSTPTGAPARPTLEVGRAAAPRSAPRPAGRLRALVADVSGEETTVVGVVSWVLLADGWRALRPHHVGGEPRVDVRTVEPADLAAELAPVLAEVTR